MTTAEWRGRYSTPRFGRAYTGDLSHVVTSVSRHLAGQRVAVHFACGESAISGWEQLTRDQFDANPCPECKP